MQTTNDSSQPNDYSIDQDLRDTLIAISIVARRLARRLDKEAFSTEEPSKATKPAKKSADLPKEETAPPETPVEKTYSFTDVRGALAAKSKEGFKEDVKKLISKYGAEKLSDINPDDYAVLMKEVEELGNG